MAAQSRPEPMNASPYHSKVRATLTLSDPHYVAGGAITGKMELECKADKGLGIGVIMVELVAIEELTSRDHSAKSTFLHSRRIYQGAGVPPSNAVLPHPLAGEPLLPANYYQARKGITSFLFKFPLPPSSPSSINFGAGLACVRYEVRASVGAAWKGDRKLVTDQKVAEVVEKYEEDFDHVVPEGVVVGDHGKIWVQGKVVGGLIVAGESACVELQVKNHSTKKTTGLSVTLTRHLHLPTVPPTQKQPLHISDTLTTVNFRGPEYTAPPGSEGVAQLVFDVPRGARTVKGGARQGSDEAVHAKESLFEVRCTVNIKIAMPIGNKDILLDLPVTIFHPDTLPPPPPDPYPLPPLQPYGSPPLAPLSPAPYLDRVASPYAFPMTPPPPQLYYNQGHLWSPPPPSQTPFLYGYMSSPPPPEPPYYYPPPLPQYLPPPRPSSAEPVASQPFPGLLPGLPPSSVQHPMLPLETSSAVAAATEPEEGKGERASRFTHHLRVTSRHRSVSPQSHRFPVLSQAAAPHPIPIPQSVSQRASPHLSLANLSPSSASQEVLSPRPMPSPKMTHTVDPFTQLSLPKTERVANLERIAAAVEPEHKNLFNDVALGPRLDKTLPGPPIPSGKNRVVRSPPYLRADKLFEPLEKGEASPPSPCPEPKTPSLSALSLLKPPRGAQTLSTPNEGGLDALERRLLAEVGTRKLEKNDARPDVRAVLPMPITIPPKPVRPDEGDAVNDSAISSLSLGADVLHEHERERAQEAEEDRHSDGKTQKEGRGGRASGSLSSEDERRTRKGKARSVASSGKGRAREKEKEKSKRGSKKKEKGDDEAVRLRKAAKGRVAEWLGMIDADVPPLPDRAVPSRQPSAPSSPRPTSPVPPPPPESPPVALVSLPVEAHPPVSRKASTRTVMAPPESLLPPDDPTKAVSRKSSAVKVDKKSPKERPPLPKRPSYQEVTADNAEPVDDAKDTTAAPNPRSSGFMPMATIRARKAQVDPENTPVVGPRVTTAFDTSLSPRARFEAALRAAPSPKLNRDLLPPRKVSSAQRLPIFPPQNLAAPATKYDVRSARGGRGGKVTAVTAIWASGAPTNASTPPPAKPKPTPPTAAPKPAALRASTPRVSKPTTGASGASPGAKKGPPNSLGVPKSVSVPAIVSSSHATPMLSSTASLSRPPPAFGQSPTRRERGARVPPAIVEDAPGKGEPVGLTQAQAKTGAGAGAGGETAFGQARLRDLIRKYQGQAAT
ncbi:hypothetical protein OF83DRAFT_458051 [Amylostereum chailletii]|nr:hypothetical protein OF83DRAFT_458051 [Amylostereum chailletii]